MIKIEPFDIVPRIRHANFIDVEPGRVWGPRQMPDFELILVVEGDFQYSSKGQDVSASKNDILCIPPDAEHVLTTGGEPAIISGIHFDLLQEGGDNVCLPDPYPAVLTRIENPDFYVNLFRQIASDFSGHSAKKYQTSCMLFKSLWVKLSEYWQGGQGPDVSAVSVKVQEMVDYLKANVLNGVDRHSLANRFDYSPEHINYLFKKELSLTPRQFVNREKIFIAFEMIQHESGTIREIADRLGFYDQYHFSKLFKQVIGSSPSKFKSLPLSDFPTTQL